MPQAGNRVSRTVRREADAYRRDEDRPLGGYVVVMACSPRCSPARPGADHFRSKRSETARWLASKVTATGTTPQASKELEAPRSRSRGPWCPRWQPTFDPGAGRTTWIPADPLTGKGRSDYRAFAALDTLSRTYQSVPDDQRDEAWPPTPT